jgi:hypothetical protein
MNTKNDVAGLLLFELWELCYRAYSGTSFSPEKRATNTIKEYSELLQEDLNSLGENSGNYKQKYIEKFSEWMRAKSNCISSMIAGPSNFPVNKANKANNSEQRKGEEFFQWREKYFKSVNRQRTLSPEEELDVALNRLDKLIINQEMMKSANKILKKKISDQQKMVEMSEVGLSDELIIESMKPDHAGRIGFPRFMLTNNNSTIKRTEEKIIIMRNRITRKENFEPIEFDGGKITIEDDRVKIYHDSKPDQSVINELKTSGFRWSPFWKCWCRKHTGNAIEVAKNLSFLKP